MEIMAPVEQGVPVFVEAVVVNSEESEWGPIELRFLEEFPPGGGVDRFADLHRSAGDLQLDLGKVRLVENQQPVAGSGIDENLFGIRLQGDHRKRIIATSPSSAPL